MRYPFDSREGGTSLVELMIGAAILGIIGVAASSFFSRVESADASSRARASTVSEITSFLNVIERDFKLRTIDVAADGEQPAMCSGCQTLVIKRKVAVGNNPEDMDYPAMDVKYDTKCASVAGAAATQFGDNGKLSFAANKVAAARAVSGIKDAPCLIECGSGKFPQIVVSFSPPANMKKISYPRLKDNIAKFPDLSDASRKDSTRKSIIGAALCPMKGSGPSTGGADRVIIEAAYVSAEGQLHLERRELTIPRNNVAKIQLLPSSN